MQANNRRTSEAFHGWLSRWQDRKALRAEQEKVATEVQSEWCASAFSTLFSYWLRLTRLLVLDRQRLSLAAEHQQSSALMSTLSAWSLFACRRRRTRALMTRADSQHSGQLLVAAWALWTATCRQSHAIKQLQKMMQRRLLEGAFGDWRDAVLNKRIAAGQRQRQQHTLRYALFYWQRVAHQNVQLASALTLSRTTNCQRLERDTFGHWRSLYCIQRQRRLWLLRITFGGWLQQLEMSREHRALMRHAMLQWKAEAALSNQQRLLSLRFYHQRLLRPAVASLRQHAQWKRSQREKAQLASSHYHATITSHSHHTRFTRTAYLAWYYYTRHHRQLLQLSDTLQQRQARVLLSSALSLWHEQTEQLRLAGEWRRCYAQTQAISDWRHWAAQQDHDKQLTGALQRMWQQKQNDRVRGAVQCWYEWCCEQRVDSAQQRLARLFHLRQLVAGWKRCVPADVRQRMKAKQKAADVFSGRLVVKRVWRAWQTDRVRRNQERSHLVEICRGRQHNRRMRAVWDEWRQRLSRVAQWSTMSDQRLQGKHTVLVKSTYTLWHHAFAQRRQEYDNCAKAERHYRSRSLVGSCRRWRGVCMDRGQRQRVAHHLVKSHAVHLVRAAMTTWLYHARLSQAAATLSAYAAQLQVQVAFSQWSELILNEQADAVLHQRQQKRLSFSLAVWRNHSLTRQQEQQSVERVRHLWSTRCVSATFHVWTTLMQQRRQLSSQSLAIALIHDRHVLRTTFSAWVKQRRIHQRMRHHALRRTLRAWRVERVRRNVEKRQLAVMVKEWKGSAAKERATEMISQRLLRIRTLRTVMGAWHSARLSDRVFLHWRQRASNIVSLSSQLHTAAAHHQRRQKQLAVHSLLHHAQQLHHVGLLQQHLSLSHHTHLLRLALSLWAQRWRDARAAAIVTGVLARQQQSAAWQRWQEVVWDEQGRRFQHHLLMRQAASALHVWTANHRQQQHDAAIITQSRSITARSLLSDAFQQFTSSFHLTRYVRGLNEAAASHHFGRVSREVFAWWYNVAIVRRHMRATRLRAIWQLWRRRVTESAEQRTAVFQSFRSWRNAAAHSKQCMQRAVLISRQKQLTAAVATFAVYAHAKVYTRTIDERAQESYCGKLSQHTWLLWQQQQQLAIVCRSQLELAAQYSASSMCARALVRWKHWRLSRRERMDTNMAVMQSTEDSRRRRAVRIWHSTAHQRRVIRSVQHLVIRPTLREWRLATSAIRADKRQLLRQALLRWTTVRHEREHERKVQQARQRRARRTRSRIMRAWTALSGTHDVVRQAGERLKEVRHQRQLRDVFDVLRTIAASSSALSQQQEREADSFYRKRHLRGLWTGWQQLAAAERAFHNECDARAERHWTTTTRRRALDAWEERTSQSLRQRHLAASQSVRLSIALRSYHTSLLLHTLSVWRAAYLAANFSPPSHRPTCSLSDSPPPRLSSMGDLRAYIEQVRGAGRAGPSTLPRSPLSAATTETGSYATSEASRPSTNGSTHDEQENGRVVWGVKGRMMRGGRIPRIDMKDL